jgi:putative membrane-bound dehydrogenase-like protein
MKIAYSILFSVGLTAVAQSPEDSLDSFQLHPDFQIELVAAEPLIFDPVDMEFDEKGRAFVIEMPGYPFPEQPGNLIMLEDTDDDGKYDKRHIFATGFGMADSIAPYNGGILVASPPDILYVADTDGDNVADVREVILTGFNVENPQHNIGGLQYALNNWIYGANGGNSGSAFWPSDPDNKTSLRFDDFRFKPESKQFELVGRSTGGFELAADDWGRWFGTHNLHHIRHLVFPTTRLRNMPTPRWGTLQNISDHDVDDMARIYPIGTQDTRVNHPEQSGFFSGACGITFYNGGAFGAEFDNNIFVCDVVLNLIHRDILEPDGATFKAKRGREKVEFLASTDRAFRPVNMTVGPDGALYVLDMHREVIEHPEWIPDEMEQNMDLDAGKEKGRIYRITPKGGLPRVTPRFSKDNLEYAINALGHANGWWRLTAQRLLVQWNDRYAIPALRQRLRTSQNPLERVHTMWTLVGLGDLQSEDLLVALKDPQPEVRENALRAYHPDLHADPMVKRRLRNMADRGRIAEKEDNLRVLMELALASPDDWENSIAYQIAIRDIDDSWLRYALFAATKEFPHRAFFGLENAAGAMANDQVRPLLALLAEWVGRRKIYDEVLGVLRTTSEYAGASRMALPVLIGLADGIETGPTPKEGFHDSDLFALILNSLLDRNDISIVRETLRIGRHLNVTGMNEPRQMIRQAEKTVRDKNTATEARLEMLSLLELTDFDDRRDLLFELLDPLEPAPIQKASITQLNEKRDETVAKKLIEKWDTLGPAARTQAGNILLYKRANHDLLLTALENEDLILGELNLDLERRRVLLFSRDEDVKKRAEALFNDAGVVTRKEALAKVRPALQLTGDPVKGKEVFTNVCVKCHRMGSEGIDLGPNLTEIFRKSPETLLHDIVDPNAAIDAEYVAYNIETKSGDIHSGLVIRDDDSGVTLREAEGIETTISRDSIREMFSNGLSLMPEELEVDMDIQSIADLIAYLQVPK